MSISEVCEYLRSLGFAPTSGSGECLERKLGPIRLYASVHWLQQRVALNGSYSDRDQMADTDGALSRSVFSMLMSPMGLLPKNPSAQDIADRIEDVLAELPELPQVVHLGDAIRSDKSVEVDRLLSSGKFPTTLRLGPNRGSMLHMARTSEMVARLAAAGVDPNQPDRSGRTPIFAARDAAVVDALLAAGASVRHRDREGRTVLHQHLPVPTLRRLIESGASIGARDQRGRVPLHYCAELPALSYLLTAGAEVDAADDAGQRALTDHLAADRLPYVGVLLAHGADPEQVSAEGETAIFFARSAAALQLLVYEYGVNINARSWRGLTPLHHCQDADCVNLLCGRGLAGDLADDEGRTPLHFSRSVGVARALLACGARVEARDRRGRTALHCAVRRSDHYVVSELLARGADPCVIDEDGNTPLHLARTIHIAQRLIAAGADPDQENFAGARYEPPAQHAAKADLGSRA